MASDIYQRSILGNRGFTRRLYGSSTFIQDLDIVDELAAHTGCVNTLCWSDSGRLLASGSDDTYLNIYAYQPDQHGTRAGTNFTFATAISTGHTNNIFSVKFMPESNDRILASCAADGQVRIFDIEYDGPPALDTGAAVPRRRRDRQNRLVFPDVRYLSSADTGGKVYRSHSASVKRLVTEASPYLLLSCSSDGDVRQWDIRQPSAAYPEAITRQFGEEGDGPGGAPPPLISYRPFRFGLNSISCSRSQPHYIALGGAHQHAFLHDRRMLRSDSVTQQGMPPPAAASHTHADDDAIDRATRCVRRFAAPPPSPPAYAGQQPDWRGSSHVMGVKISDWNPNELVVSWSGDHIYSFDLVAPVETPAVGFERPPPSGSASGSGLRLGSALRGLTIDQDSYLAVSRTAAGMHPGATDNDGDGDDAASTSSDDVPALLHPRTQPLHTQTPLAPAQRTYRGHCNTRTTKSPSFAGPRDEYLLSGSDDGHLFLWSRATTQLLSVLEADGEVVNVAAAHPHEHLLLAVSGLDDSVKVFGVDGGMVGRAREGRGLGLGGRGAGGWEGGGPRPRRAYGAGTRRAAGTLLHADGQDPALLAASSSASASSPTTPASAAAAPPDAYDTDPSTLPPTAPHGLACRKRTAKAYEIVAKNDVDRREARDEQVVLSRAVLRRLAASYLAAGGGGGVQVQGVEGGRLVIDGADCPVQ